jgi:hypothetical protein
LKSIFKELHLKADLSFTVVRTNFGPPIKLFRHYAFSSLVTFDTQGSAEPGLRNIGLGNEDVNHTNILLACQGRRKWEVGLVLRDWLFVNEEFA